MKIKYCREKEIDGVERRSLTDKKVYEVFGELQTMKGCPPNRKRTDCWDIIDDQDDQYPVPKYCCDIVEE